VGEAADCASQKTAVSRRSFVSLAAHAAAGVAAGWAAGQGGLCQGAEAPNETAAPKSASPAPAPIPYGMIGKVKLSRMLLGGNLVTGGMHCRDLQYVRPLFRAYVTEQKLFETFRLAEAHGINTVFESGAAYVSKYNKQCGGRLQIIPHIQVDAGQSDEKLNEHIQTLVDTGAPALYVWGVSADRLIEAGDVKQLARGVELAKKTGLPIGVGSHSLLVPMACEKHQIPCDFYVKTLHSDDYFSATPKPKRKEFSWIHYKSDWRETGWNDNMWCINPEETIAFMHDVKKPWIAFKVLAAGALLPINAFPYAFKNGADFIAVGMFDFEIKANCELVSRVVRLTQKRERPWFA
jgi:hypothetical protein